MSKSSKKIKKKPKRERPSAHAGNQGKSTVAVQEVNSGLKRYSKRIFAGFATAAALGGSIAGIYALKDSAPWPIEPKVLAPSGNSPEPFPAQFSVRNSSTQVGIHISNAGCSPEVMKGANERGSETWKDVDVSDVYDLVVPANETRIIRCNLFHVFPLSYVLLHVKIDYEYTLPLFGSTKQYASQDFEWHREANGLSAWHAGRTALPGKDTDIDDKRQTGNGTPGRP